MAYEGLINPTGATPAALYSWANNHVGQLRRILNEAAEADSDLTALEASVTTLQARVLALETDAIDGILTPQQAFELSLTTAAGEIFGSISYLNNLLRTKHQENADATIAAAINANRANVGIRNEVAVRSSADFALAQQINAVVADLGVTDAAVVVLTQAVADGDSALATQITNVSSSVAGNTAQIQVLIESVDGVQTQYAVQLNNNGEVTGYIRLDGTPLGSNFVVATDNFYVGKAGTTGGTSVPVFAIQTVNGAAKIAFRGDMYADGTIIARHIAAGSITADKINVTTLAALTANLGTITAGLIRDAANVYNFDVPNGLWKRTDNKSYIDMKNNKFRFSSA